MKPYERQVAPTIEGIRADHVARYRWAARRIPSKSRIVDFACGVGYGCKILADAGHAAHGFDIDAEAITYANKHYRHPDGRTDFSIADGNRPDELGSYDAAVCFETVEHLKDPLPLLKALRQDAKLLLVSVPNEDVMPWRRESDGATMAFHFRHYTPMQFAGLLKRAGWRVDEWWGQEGPDSEVERNLTMGRTIIAVCTHAGAEMRPETAEKTTKKALKHVSIVGLGPSSASYVDLVKRMGGRHQYCDETWVINAFGDVLAHDVCFHMDDVRIQQIRADAEPDSNIAAMLKWLETHPGPVITSCAHPDYPGMVEFPLEDVVNAFPQGYFNSTAAYAVAYAVHLGFEKISLFGVDFTYPNAHDAEKGRACVEFWLGIAAAKGIQLVAPKTSTILDALHTQAERFYGFDCVDLMIKREGGRIVISRTEKAEFPSAEEVEANYDHKAHPNAIVREAPENRAASRAPEMKD